MTFRDLMKRLGEPKPTVWRVSDRDRWGCSLPYQPLDRLKAIEGCTIVPAALNFARFEIPVEEGIVQILGKVQVEDDGSQTLIDVSASLRETANAA